MSERPQSTEAAIELFLELRARGEETDSAAFVARHPEFAPELASALESLLTLEHATRSPDDDGLPDRIGAFRVVREVGRGGMGVVLEAVEEPLQRRVALKVLPPELLASSSARARFRREAELAARLDHSGIATVYGAGVESDRPWIAMRYVEGETLARRIAAARAAGASSLRFPGANTAGLEPVLVLAACIAQVARALQFAHEQGVVHRDVKPSNVIVTPSGVPVLLDFGLAISDANAPDSDARTLTRTGETAGTPAYLAPEIIGAEIVRPDAQSDVYSLGVTLYECLALRRPFDAATPAALYHAILDGAATNLRAIHGTGRNIPRDLAVVVATAMERDRNRRYRSAAALADDLEACVAGRPILARPVPVYGRVLRWARREPGQALLAGALVIATLATAVFAGTWWQSRKAVREATRLTNAEAYEKRLQAGYSGLATNWLEESYRSFELAEQIVPGSAEAIAGRALVRLKQRRDADAVVVLEKAPATPAFDSLRALASGQLPAIEHDASWFATASSLEMFVDGMRLQKQMERTPRDGRRHVAAIALSRFEEAVGRSLTTRMLYQVQRASAASAAQDERAIRSAAAALVVLWPDQERALFTAGLALSDVDAKQAIPLLEAAIRLDPGWGAPYQVLGNARLGVNDYAGAEIALSKAIEIDPKDADAWNSLGMARADMNCVDEARTAYIGALRLRPMWETWANLALLDATLADAAVEESGRLAPGSAPSVGDREASGFPATTSVVHASEPRPGVQGRPLGQRDIAEAELRWALAGSPRENALRIPLANLLARYGDARAALWESATVLGFDPKSIDGWRMLAELHATLGDFDTAQDAADIGLELAPDDARLLALRDAARHPTGSTRVGGDR